MVLLPEMRLASTAPRDALWRAVYTRDSSYDGTFVYAVRSTRIYCKPSCASRKPGPENVVLFSTREDARKAGFRACLRCGPDRGNHVAERIQKVIEIIETRPQERLTLKILGERVGLSPYHLQRSFKRATGVTPRHYSEEIRLRTVKIHLKRGESVRRSTYDSGRSSTSWLYADGGTKLGMEASAYRKGGEGKRIFYAIVSCSLGQLLVAGTNRGICMVAVGDSRSAVRQVLSEEYPSASLESEPGHVGAWIRTIVDYIDGSGDSLLRQLPLEIQATAFQRRVWNELRSIPMGSTRTYGEIAESIGSPSAVRAVARACAANPVALVIPCHRVIGKDGSLRGYRWGLQRKKSLIRIEEASVGESEGKVG